MLLFREHEVFRLCLLPAELHECQWLHRLLRMNSYFFLQPRKITEIRQSSAFGYDAFVTIPPG